MELKVWICDLGSYNEGRSIGKWFEVPLDEEEVYETLKETAESVGTSICAQEFAIHDYDCSIRGVKIGEYEHLEFVNELAEMLEALEDELGEDMLGDILTEIDCNIKNVYEHIKDIQVYSGQTLEDVAYELVEEMVFGDIPESIQSYIDYKAIARDLGFGEYTETSNGVVVWC